MRVNDIGQKWCRRAIARMVEIAGIPLNSATG
jgi:hypothetical protein